MDEYGDLAAQDRVIAAQLREHFGLSKEDRQLLEEYERYVFKWFYHKEELDETKQVLERTWVLLNKAGLNKQAQTIEALFRGVSRSLELSPPEHILKNPTEGESVNCEVDTPLVKSCKFDKSLVTSVVPAGDGLMAVTVNVPGKHLKALKAEIADMNFSGQPVLDTLLTKIYLALGEGETLEALCGA